jgi:hypothetical protein
MRFWIVAEIPRGQLPGYDHRELDGKSVALLVPYSRRRVTMVLGCWTLFRIVQGGVA